MKQILKRPLITEKATERNEQGLYVFLVDKSATKAQIKDAVEEMYKDQEVKVKSVRTAIIFGKPKYKYTRTTISRGHTQTYKKAFVQLAKDSVIDIYGEE